MTRLIEDEVQKRTNRVRNNTNRETNVKNSEQK